MDGRPLIDSAALVTGATSGIGRATALALAAAGANVAVAARRTDRLESLADEIREEHGREALPVTTDVTDDAQVDDLVDRTVSAFGGLDVVVANAGVGVTAPVEDLPTEDYRLMMDVNCDGMFYVARAAIPHLVESKGNLIFLGSMAGEYPRPANPVYAATKWWTRGLALSLSGAIGDEDVAVSVVNPSEVRTEFGSEEDDSFEERFDPGEVTEPEEVAEAIVFAAGQSPPDNVTELDLFRRDKFAHF